MDELKTRYGTVRPGDGIAVSYSHRMVIGIFAGTHMRENDVVRYYGLPWPITSDPNGKFAKDWLDKNLDDFVKKTPNGNEYIYGVNVSRRIIPYDIESLRGWELYETLRSIQKQVQSEYQNHWSEDHIN
jgi:hypothetical protein